MHETWITVSGYDGYEVSNLGRVRSTRPINRFAREPDTPRILNPFSKGKRRYLYCSLRKDGVLWSARVHHLVLEAFVGPRLEGLEGCHKDDNQENNRLDNLYWGTPAQNVEDKLRNGKQVRGSANHFAAIDENKAKEIKLALRMDSSRGNIERISKALNVSRHIVSNIKNEKSWRHL